jgi:hypothetical protein
MSSSASVTGHSSGAGIKRAEFHGEWNYTISPKTYPPNRAFIS